MLSCGSVTLPSLHCGLEGRPRAMLGKCPPCPLEQRTSCRSTHAPARWLLPCSQSSLWRLFHHFPFITNISLEKDLETEQGEEIADPTMPTKPHLHLHGCPPNLGQQESSFATTAMPREIQMCILHLARGNPSCDSCKPAGDPSEEGLVQSPEECLISNRPHGRSADSLGLAVGMRGGETGPCLRFLVSEAVLRQVSLIHD